MPPCRVTNVSLKDENAGRRRRDRAGVADAAREGRGEKDVNAFAARRDRVGVADAAGNGRIVGDEDAGPVDRGDLAGIDDSTADRAVTNGDASAGRRTKAGLTDDHGRRGIGDVVGDGYAADADAIDGACTWTCIGDGALNIGRGLDRSRRTADADRQRGE